MGQIERASEQRLEREILTPTTGYATVDDIEMEGITMTEAKKNHYAVLAEKIIEKLKLRNMEGYYAATKEEARALAKEKFLKGGVSVCWGGSMTLSEIGLMDDLTSGRCDCVVYDRMTAQTPEQLREMKANMINSDYFLMSTNAITLDGELVNIDGAANRVNYLCYGPENVLIFAGMNKVAANVEEAISRVRNIASPPNAMRLNRDTPCAKAGRCADCQAEECICCQTVITRRSMVRGRIKVILIGEELGF